MRIYGVENAGPFRETLGEPDEASRTRPFGLQEMEAPEVAEGGAIHQLSQRARPAPLELRPRAGQCHLAPRRPPRPSQPAELPARTRGLPAALHSRGRA